MTDWPFAPRSWPFDTPALAGMTMPGPERHFRMNKGFGAALLFLVWCRHTGATAGRPYRAAAENVRRQAKARCSKRAMTPYSMISIRITKSRTHASTCSMSKFSNQKKNM